MTGMIPYAAASVRLATRTRMLRLAVGLWDNQPENVAYGNRTAKTKQKMLFMQRVKE